MLATCCLLLLLSCASIAFHSFGVQYMFDEWDREVAYRVMTAVSFGFSLFRGPY